MGLSLILLGDVEEGSANLREAIAVSPVGFERTSAWSNLADALHLVGRSDEAVVAAEQGLADTAGGGRASDWMSMTLGEIQWDLGDWAAARAAHVPGRPPPQRHDARLRRAQARGGRARRRRARAGAGLARPHRRRSWRARASRSSSAWPGRCAASSSAAAGISPRRAPPSTTRLDAIEFCSEDLARIARLAETGTAIEADAAQRARDLGDGEAEREAIARAEGFVMRSEGCAADGRPVEVARLASARAHLARAGGAAEPALDAATAAAWRAVARPYPAAIAELRRAETLAARGDRDAAAAQLAEVLTAADALGAAWLRGEAEGLAARARLTVAAGVDGEAAPEPAAEGGDPFGLTPRERQVLALVADGATNREIGAQLYMAEKTASVHVSRILAKLDVRSRTEAAAVAHRFGLARPSADPPNSDPRRSARRHGGQAASTATWRGCPEGPGPGRRAR